MASAAAASDVTDGPVLTLINKRIRNLRKKLNRIAQLEESIAQGKSTVKNKEQEELLKSKPSIVAAVDELEKFRQPLSVAVDEEINLAIQHRQVKSSENNGKEVDGDSVAKTLDSEENAAAPKSDLSIEDLLSLIYFGSMFDVKSQSDFSSIMLTRTHERNCCLMYDYVTDDAGAVMLGERDLDLILTMGSLMISRPMNSSFSHQNALQRCIEHAKLWLAKSEQPIDSNSDVTYASLREKLAKIIGSDFFRITPAMKASADVAAEAADSYGFQVPVQVESSVAQPERKEDDVTDLQRNETGEEDQSSPVKDPLKHDSEEAEISVETHPSKEQYQYVPRRNFHNQRGGGGGRNNGGGGGGRRGGYGNGRGGRSGGRGGPYQNGGRNQYNDQEGNYYPRNNHGGRGRGGGRGGGGGGGGGHYSNGGNNGYNHHASFGVEV